MPRDNYLISNSFMVSDTQTIATQLTCGSETQQWPLIVSRTPASHSVSIASSQSHGEAENCLIIAFNFY